MFNKNKILIFIVDDDKLFLNALSKHLSQSIDDVEIRKFISGEDCLKEIHEYPDIVILDYYLSEEPGHRNGLSILKSICCRSSSTFTIVVSSSKSEQLKEKLYENEAVLFISKDTEVFKKCDETIKVIQEKILARGKYKKMPLYILYLVIFITVWLVFRFVIMAN